MLWAAGLGTRLRPLTENMAKAMVPVAGIPMLEHAVYRCKEAGITEIMINLHYFAEVIQDYFGDGKRWGVNIQYSYEESLLENAGALIKVRNFFGDAPFIAFGSDNLSDIDLADFLDFHQKNQALATLATTEADDVSKYGIVEISDSHEVRSFQEKPTPEEALSDQVATCIYAFDAAIFDHLPPTPVKIHFGKEVFPELLVKGLPVFAYRHQGYWNDIGNPSSYLAANFHTLQGELPLPPTITFEDYEGDKRRIPDSSQLGEGVTLKGNVLIGENCRIASGTTIGPDVVIGNNTTIGKNAEISDSVLWDNNTIEDKCEITHSVFAKGCQLFAGSAVRHEVLGEGSQLNHIRL